MPLLPADHTPPSFTPTPEVLSKVRQYLTLCRGLNYAMSAEMKSVSHAKVYTQVLYQCDVHIGRVWKKTLLGSVVVTLNSPALTSTTCCAQLDCWPLVMAVLPSPLNTGHKLAVWTRTDYTGLKCLLNKLLANSNT